MPKGEGAYIRMGELLRMIEKAKGGAAFHATRGGGGPSRVDAAKRAGISERQAKEAKAMSRVPT